MVQIAMAVKDVPYEDIVFVQYPTEYDRRDCVSHVLPVTDAADALFAALRANQPITLTGEASQGYGVEVDRRSRRADSDADDGCRGATPAPSRLRGRRGRAWTCRRRSPGPPRRRSPAPARSSEPVRSRSAVERL